MKLYRYDMATGEYQGEQDAQQRPNGEWITDVLGATPQQPPVTGEKQAAVWTGEGWEIEEDHRQARDKGGVVAEGSGTPYWLPGDTWQAPARYLNKLGPLPENALLIKPEKDLNTLKTEKKAEIIRAHEAATVATLTMPAASPGTAKVAVDAALFAVEDADGLAYITETLAAYRDGLLAQVEACSTADELSAIEVEFPV